MTYRYYENRCIFTGIINEDTLAYVSQLNVINRIDVDRSSKTITIYFDKTLKSSVISDFIHLIAHVL